MKTIKNVPTRLDLKGYYGIEWGLNLTVQDAQEAEVILENIFNSIRLAIFRKRNQNDPEYSLVPVLDGANATFTLTDEETKEIYGRDDWFWELRLEMLDEKKTVWYTGEFEITNTPNASSAVDLAVTVSADNTYVIEFDGMVTVALAVAAKQRAEQILALIQPVVDELGALVSLSEDAETIAELTPVKAELVQIQENLTALLQIEQNLTALNNVNNNEDNINTVAGTEDEIVTIATDLNDENSKIAGVFQNLASIIGNYNNEDNITAVAGKLSQIQTAVYNMQAILNAPGAATSAGESAALAQRYANEDEDVPVEEDPDTFSAKHFLAKTQAEAAQILSKIDFTGLQEGDLLRHNGSKLVRVDADEVTQRTMLQAAQGINPSQVIFYDNLYRETATPCDGAALQSGQIISASSSVSFTSSGLIFPAVASTFSIDATTKIASYRFSYMGDITGNYLASQEIMRADDDNVIYTINDGTNVRIRKIVNGINEDYNPNLTLPYRLNLRKIRLDVYRDTGAGVYSVSLFVNDFYAGKLDVTDSEFSALGTTVRVRGRDVKYTQFCAIQNTYST